MSDEKQFTAAEAQKHFGIEFNNLTWELLGKSDRTAEEDERMIHSAHASLLHWQSCGTAAHAARGAWMIARVNSELGYGSTAQRYAAESERLCSENPEVVADFDVAYAAEALARSSAVAGDLEAAARHFATARERTAAIADDEDRSLVEGDLAGGNWGDFTPPAA